MKKIVLVLVVLFSTNILFAQSSETTQDYRKDKFVLNDGLIEATLFHKNGTIAQTGFYTEDNKLHGEWVSYDVEGNKTAIASYDNGEKVGTWIFYQGDNKKEVIYLDSRISHVNTWEKTDTRIVTKKP